MKNIEIKYQVSDLAEIYTFLSAHPDVTYKWSEEQTDIYFGVPVGRLKLRQQSNSTPQLIYYQRRDSNKLRESEYYIHSTSNANNLRIMLEKALGVKAVVYKKRSLFMFRNIRIHLDEVTNSGNFMEFESVLDADTNEGTARQNLQDLLTIFSSFRLIPREKSYADLCKVD